MNKLFLKLTTMTMAAALTIGVFTPDVEAAKKKLTVNKVYTSTTKVKGKTKKKYQVRIKIGKKTYKATASKKGSYSVKIPKQKVGKSFYVSAYRKKGKKWKYYTKKKVYVLTKSLSVSAPISTSKYIKGYTVPAAKVTAKCAAGTKTVTANKTTGYFKATFKKSIGTSKINLTVKTKSGKKIQSKAYTPKKDSSSSNTKPSTSTSTSTKPTTESGGGSTDASNAGWTKVTNNDKGGKDYYILPTSPTKITLRAGKDELAINSALYPYDRFIIENTKILRGGPTNYSLGSSGSYKAISNGTTTIRFTNATINKTITVTVTGGSDDYYTPALKKVAEICDQQGFRSSSLTQYQKAEKVIKYIADTYAYKNAYTSGIKLLLGQTQYGDCYAGAQLTCLFLDELGIPCIDRYAGQDPVNYGQTAAHHNNLALLDGKLYIIDGTPGTGGLMGPNYKQLLTFMANQGKPWTDPNIEDGEASADYNYILSLEK